MDYPRRKAKTIRPYLTTAELLEASHVTRKTLRGAEESGFLEAAYVDNTDYYKYWNIHQLDQLRLFGLLRTGDVSRKAIAEAAEGDLSSFLELSYAQSVAQMRTLRRTMRAISFQQEQVDDFCKSADIPSPYVGYQPTRWLALIPACSPEEVETEVTAERFIDRLLDLRRIIEVVGWAPSFQQGSLTCFDPLGNPSARFVYIELVCPPGISMYGRAMDCGCYRAFDPEGEKGHCASHACHVCARFGRKPTDKEAARWAQAKGNYPWRVDAQSDDQASTVALWKQYVQEGQTLRAKGKPSHEPSVQNSYEATTIARPVAMPHEVVLPLGVTACALPAGMYATERVEQHFSDSTRESFLSMLRDLPRTPCSKDLQTFDVHERPRRHKKKSYNRTANQGPFAEPFIATHHIEDPAWTGWHAPITSDNHRALSLMTEAGLFPKDGYCVVERFCPDDKSTEISALVHLDNIFFN